MSTGESLTDFLARIRDAAGRRGPSETPTPPVVDPEVVRLADADDDLVALFAKNARDVGMHVEHAAAASWIAGLVAALIGRGVRTCMVAIERTGLETELSEALQGAGIEVVPWRRAALDRHFDVDAGITDVHAALAETGSLVLCTSAAHGRALSLIPPLHVAVVRHSDIIPDLLDWTARTGQIPAGALPSAQVLITGPSKTSDIEGILITGVHGPEAVHIVLIDDSGGEK